MQQRWAGTRNAAATYALHIALGSVEASTTGERGGWATQGTRKGGAVIGGWPRTRRCAAQPRRMMPTAAGQIPSVPPFWGPLGASRWRRAGGRRHCWGCRRAGGLERERPGAARQDETRRRDGETARRRRQGKAGLIWCVLVRWMGRGGDGRNSTIPYACSGRSAGSALAGDSFRLLCEARTHRLDH